MSSLSKLYWLQLWLKQSARGRLTVATLVIIMAAALVALLDSHSPPGPIAISAVSSLPPSGLFVAPDVVASDVPSELGIPFDWPERVKAATSMFECWSEQQGERASLVVWTDQAKQVVAFGSAREVMQLPAYASPLFSTLAVDAGLQVQGARGGHTVQASNKDNALHLGPTKLNCVPTWDD